MKGKKYLVDGFVVLLIMVGIFYSYNKIKAPKIETASRDIASKRIELPRIRNILNTKKIKKFWNRNRQILVNFQKFRSCAVDLCGNPDSMFSPTQLSELKRKKDPNVISGFEKLVNEYADLNIDKTKKEMVLKLKMQSQAGFLISQNIENLIEPTLKKLILGFEYLDILNEFSSFYISTAGEGRDFNYNTKQFLQNLDDSRVNQVLSSMTLNPKDRIWFKELLLSGLLLESRINPWTGYDLELSTLLKILYPKDDFNAAILKQVKKTFELSKSIGSSLGLDENIGAFTESINLYKNPTIMYNEKNIAMEIVTYYTIEPFFQSKYDHILSRDFNWSAYVRSVLNIDRKLSIAVNDERVLTKALTDIKGSCLLNIESTLDHANSELGNKKFREYSVEMLAETKKVIKFSNPATQSEFNQKMDDLSISQIGNLAYLNRVMTSAIQNLINNENQYLDLLNRGDAKSFQAILLKNINTITNFDDLGHSVTGEEIIADLFYELEDVCSMFQSASPGFNDQSYAVYGQIKLDWATVRFPHFGVGFAAHEIGHYVADTLVNMGQKQKSSFYRQLNEKLPLWEARSCIDMFHDPKVVDKYLDFAGLFESSKSQLNENMYTEEDWADYFAANITKEMSRKYPWIKNFACQFFPKSEDGSFLVDVNAYRSEVHSPDLRRALFIQKVMGRPMPQTCQSLIDEHSLFECMR